MSTIDDIKARLDIVEVVAKYVPDLRQTGRNFSARCPFHQERTPSFRVFPDRQAWRCFGACAVGGDVFSFVMKAEGIDFGAALRRLAEVAGVALPDPRAAAERQSHPIFALNAAAQRLFREAFDADRGSVARAYVHRRGISDEAAAAFGLGYSGTGEDDLVRRLEAMGFARELMLGAGLATARDGGQARDLLRGRLVFPIRNEAGEIAGFAGRALDDAQPKYMNTPQTAVFDKGRTLYAFDRAKDAIAAERRAVVVEGYMDVIAAHEHGFRNVVASMGTALTDDQIGLLARPAETIVLALDADPAGQGSMFRALLDLARRSAAVDARRQGAALRRAKVFDAFRVAALEDAKDPDDLIRSDPGRWRQAVEEAVPLADFLLDAAPRHLDLSTPAGRAEAAEALRSVVVGVGWDERDRYLQRLASMLEVEAATLRAALVRSEAQASAAARAPQAGRVSEADFRRVKGDPLEERALVLVLRFADMNGRAGDLAAGHYQRPENLAVLSEIQAGGTIDEVRARLDSHSAEHLDRLLEMDLPPMDFKQRSADFDECIRRLEERALRRQKADEQLVFAETAAAGTPAPPGIEEQALAVNERLRQLFAASARLP